MRRVLTAASAILIAPTVALLVAPVAQAVPSAQTITVTPGATAPGGAVTVTGRFSTRTPETDGQQMVAISIAKDAPAALSLPGGDPTWADGTCKVEPNVITCGWTPRVDIDRVELAVTLTVDPSAPDGKIPVSALAEGGGKSGSVNVVRSSATTSTTTSTGTGTTTSTGTGTTTELPTAVPAGEGPLQGTGSSSLGVLLGGVSLPLLMGAAAVLARRRAVIRRH